MLSKSPREVGDFVEVAVMWFQVFTVDAGFCIVSGTAFCGVVFIEFVEGSNEGFPLRFRVIFESVGVKIHLSFVTII